MIGTDKHVAARCDEDEGHTWDVYYRGRVVGQGFPTRKAARAWGAMQDETRQIMSRKEARRLDALGDAIDALTGGQGYG